MSPTVMIIGLIALAALGYAVSIYNFFQTTKARIKASIQEIGNQLKRQASLIPNLESSAKGYLKHEKDVFKLLTDARKSVTAAQKDTTPQSLSALESKLQALIPKLQVVLEDNPEFKADQVVSRLMNELRDTADKLMYARRTLIDLAAAYNIKLTVLPSNLVAGIFGFKPEKGLETPDSGAHVSVSQSETKDVKVSL